MLKLQCINDKTYGIHTHTHIGIGPLSAKSINHSLPPNICLKCYDCAMPFDDPARNIALLFRNKIKLRLVSGKLLSTAKQNIFKYGTFTSARLRIKISIMYHAFYA